MQFRDYKAVKDRRKAVENHIGVPLPEIGSFSAMEDVASSRNCENMIGFAAIPLGIAGPLFIAGDREYYLPLATTEGALVASVNRGCKAITQSGGAKVKTETVGISRAPVFVVSDITQGYSFIEWIKKHQKDLAEIAQSTSHHVTLLDIRCWMEGRNVFVRFSFDSNEAMGMNMATIAVSEMVVFIEAQTQVSCVAVSGNMCVDKKPNFLNFIEGRGHRVWADVLIPATIIQSVLKSSASAIYEVAERKLVAGSAMAGTIGANAHIANVLAAMFLATGQDIAHIAECSMGITSVEKIQNDLYVSVYLPDMVVGTVGGGTNLATQKEARAILQLQADNGKTQAVNLAQVMGAAALAGEISLLASLAQGTLSSAHKKLGRGKQNI